MTEYEDIGETLKWERDNVSTNNEGKTNET